MTFGKWKLILIRVIFLSYGISILALLDFVSRATVVVQASVVCLSAVHPSVCKLSFSETAAWIQAKVCGVDPSPPYVQAILICFLKNFNFQIFTIFFAFVYMGSKISKSYSSIFHPI